MLRRLLLVICSALMLAVPIQAQSPAWTGIIASGRGIDWRGNGATIVNRTTQCGSTIAAYGTLTSPQSAAAIQNAFNACPANTYLSLGAGSFYLNSTPILTNPNVTLRGAGPMLTFIVLIVESSNCNGVNRTALCVINGDSSAFNNNGAPSVAWTANYSAGTTTITLASTTGLRIGSNMILSQNDDASEPGDIYICQTSGVTGACSQQGGGGVARAGAAQTQNVTVTGISGNNVTFTPPIYMPNWTSGKSPVAWWSSNPTLVGVGLENFTLDYSHIGSAENAIEFHNSRDCWVKNIRFINNTASGGATHKAVNIYASNHVTVRDSYTYGASPTSEGYGVDNGPGSANDLIENNIFQHMPTGMINETTCCNTFGYNFAVDDYYINGAPNWQQQSEFHHGAGDHYVLWEGNENQAGVDLDDIHGTSWFLTHFRDYLGGHDPVTVPPSAPAGPKNQATFAYFPFANNRYNNIIGSVLGTSTYHLHYQNTPATTTDCTGVNGDSAHSVFVFGFGDQAGMAYTNACTGTSFTLYNDSLVASSQMRWGNYAACTGDALCNVVRWNSGETASSAPTYPGLASPSMTLPPSFYLSAKPGFWDSSPFPGIGPDVTGGNIPNVGGHANHNPAGNCYFNTMGGKTDGSSGILSFDANICYPGGGTPQAPAPTVAPSSGPYTSPQTITITCPTPLCAYTNDGTTPTGTTSGTITHGTTYSAPFSQSLPVTIQSIAVQSGFTPSLVTVNTLTLTGSTSTVNWTSVHQVIDGFGAAAPLIGDGNHNLTSAQQSLFFGLGPSQLGLSLLRVGLPDGGNAPGDCSSASISCAGSNVPDMQAAIAQGARIYATPWSPPAIYKTNSSVVCSPGSGALATGSYANYATWLVNFAKSLKNNYSINLYAFSVQNEPDFCATYDAAQYTDTQFDTFIKTNLGPTLASSGLSPLPLLFMPETGTYAAIAGGNGGDTCMTDSACYTFVQGNNWHDYDATANSAGAVSSAANPWVSLNKKYWETEASCGLGYGPSGCEGGAFKTDMITDGLMWAGIIDRRMVTEGANAYLYWALIGPTTDNEGLTSTAGTVAQRAYVFGQYAKFIRPGFFRIDATHAPQSGVAVSAYQNTGNGTLAIVATNYNGSAVTQGFTISNAPTFATMTPYVTSTSQNIAVQTAVSVAGNSFSFLLPAQSVTTFVSTMAAPTVVTPVIAPPAGVVTFPITVTMSTTTPGATICWTSDGSTPTINLGVCVNGTTYTGGFALSTAATVKALAGKSGSADSGVASNVYTTASAPAAPTGLTATPF